MGRSMLGLPPCEVLDLCSSLLRCPCDVFGRASRLSGLSLRLKPFNSASRLLCLCLSTGFFFCGQAPKGLSQARFFGDVGSARMRSRAISCQHFVHERDDPSYSSVFFVV